MSRLTLKDLNDLAKKANLDPAKCVILLHGECANGDVELDFVDRMYPQKSVKVLNKDDEFEVVEQAISVQQLWIPDMFGN
jgi:hypothetical protein